MNLRPMASLSGVLFAGVLAACGPIEEAREELPREFARHVILVTIGRFRADHLSLLGGQRDTGGLRYDPAVARLERDHSLSVIASQGTLFSNAHVPSSTFEGGMRGWLFGESAADLGSPPEGISLAELLHSKGWRTAAFLSGFPLSGESVLARGFEEMVYRPLPHDLTRFIGEWAERIDSQRVFAWVHLDIPDSPCDVGSSAIFEYVKLFLDPEDWGGLDFRMSGMEDIARAKTHLPAEILRRISARYDARLVFLHDQLRGALWSLSGTGGLLQDAFLVVASDRGCELGTRDGYVGSERSARDGSLHVPLVVRAPAGFPRDVVDDRLVEAADLYPTVLRAVNLAAPDGLVGRDLRSPLRRAVVTGRSGEGARSVRTRRYRLILPPDRLDSSSFHRGVELYDWTLPDPESHDLATARPDIVAELGAYR